MSKPGGIQLFMGDTNHPAADATLMRLIAKTSKLAYLVDSAGVEYPLQGVPLSFFKRDSATMVAGQLVVVFASLGMSDEPDTDYSIAPLIYGDETLRGVAKLTTGFTLASSDGGSTSMVDWVIVRTA